MLWAHGRKFQPLQTNQCQCWGIWKASTEFLPEEGICQNTTQIHVFFAAYRLIIIIVVIVMVVAAVVVAAAVVVVIVVVVVLVVVVVVAVSWTSAKINVINNNIYYYWCYCYCNYDWRQWQNTASRQREARQAGVHVSYVVSYSTRSARSLVLGWPHWPVDAFDNCQQLQVLSDDLWPELSDEWDQNETYWGYIWTSIKLNMQMPAEAQVVRTPKW